MMENSKIKWMIVFRNLFSWFLHIFFLPVTFVIGAISNLYWIYENRYEDMELAWPWEEGEKEMEDDSE